MSNPPRSWPSDAPSLRSRHITLIAKSGRDLIWACNVGEKQSLLAASKGPIWAVWTGQYSSHLFSVPRKQVAEELS